MKLLLENWRKHVNEAEGDLFDLGGDLGLMGLKKKYPQEAAALEKKGLLDRYFAAAMAEEKRSKGENVLSPSQYLREPDKVDAYLGLSQETPTPAPSSAGGKQAVTSNIQKMYDDLRTYDTKFKRNPEIRKKYEAALGAVNALLRSVS